MPLDDFSALLCSPPVVITEPSDDLGAQDVGRGRPPAHRVRATGVVRDHPPQGAGPPGPRVGGEEQALEAQRGLEIVEDDARLDRRLKVRAVDLEDPAHPRE